MPSSVSEGTRPRAARMRSYSCAVMLCAASNCGVTATGEGTTAEEAEVITVASIVARRLRCGRRLLQAASKKARWACGKPGKIQICRIPMRREPAATPARPGFEDIWTVAHGKWLAAQRLCDTLEASPTPK